jgi:hydroxypyruvate isomerase
MPRFAANLSLLYTELPFLDRFAAAARSGFTAVEFLFPYAFAAQDIRQRLDDNGLQLVLHNFAPGNWEAGDRGLACDPARVAEFRATVAQGLEYAQVLGAPQLHCLAGIAPAGVPANQLRDTYLENLAHAAAACKAAGKRVLIEPINTYDFPGYYLTGTAQAIGLLDALATDSAALQYDIYHAQRTEGELAATLEKHLPRMAHIQIADNPGRHEPGSGEIHYDFLLALLDRLGYAGWVGCEYRPRQATEAGLGWLQRWQSAASHSITPP